MTRKNPPKEKPLEELKALKQRVVELEALAAAYQADEKYKAVFESANDGLLLIDKKGGIIDVNKKIKDFSGYAREELIGKNIASLVQMMTKKSLALTQSNFLKRLVGVNIPPYEVEMIIKNGESVIIEISAQPLTENDKIVGDLVILRDVTKRKLTEEAAKESEQNFRSLMDNSAMGIRIRDADEYVVYANQALLNIFGYENIDELRASPPQDHYTPASYAEYLQRKEKLLRGEPVSNTLEVDIICKDGTIRCLQVFGKSLLWNGKTQTQTFYNDITERKQAEEALATIEQNLRNSLDNLPMGFRITDIDDNTLYLNQAFLNIFGYENIDEVNTNPPLKHYTAESYAEYLQRKQKLLRGEPRQEKVEVDIVRKDSAIRHLQLSTGELVWNGKKQFQTLYNDITEKRKTEMALIKSEQNLKEAQRVGGIGSWELDITTGEVEWSDEFYRLYERDKTLGPRNPDEETKFYSSEQNKMFREYARRAVKNGEEFNYDLTANLPSGKIALFNTTLHPVKDDKGRVIKLFGTVQDITERKRAEEALKLSERNFRNSMDGSIMGIYITDTDWHILYVNQAFLDLFGYKNIDEVRASPPHEHYTPEEHARHLVRNERRLRGEPNPDQFELDIVHKDGTIRHLQAFRKEVLWDGKQQSQLLYNDITARKVTEEALKVSEQNFRNSLNGSLMGIYITDKNWHPLYANQAFLDMFGYENIDEVGARPPHEYYTPESHAALILRQERQLHGEPALDKFEIAIVRKDSSIRHLQIFRKEILWNGEKQHQLFYNDITERKIVENALKTSEENFRNSIDSSSIGINIIDANFYTSYVNQAFLDIFGYKNIDEVRVSPPYKYYTPETNADVAPRGEKIMRGEPVSNQYEIDIIRKDSTLHHLQISRKEIFWDGKQQYQILYNDITERKQAEEALKASEQNFRNSMDNTLLGIRISDIDNNTLYANQALLDIFGYKNIDELKAIPPHEYYTPQWYADYLVMKEKLSRGETMPIRAEIDIVRKDGDIRHLQALFKEVVWNGKLQYQTLYNDITERKQAEEALRVSEEKYRLIVENSQDIIFTLDSAGKFIYVSPSVKQMLGYNQTDLIGRPFNSLVHPEDLHVIEDAVRLGDEAGHHQYRFRNASGEWRWHVTRGTKMLDTGGKSFNFTGISNDITDRKQAEEALKASEQNFRNSIDSSSVGIRISDIDNHTLYANQTLLDIFGYKNIDELKSTPPHEYYSPEYYADYLKIKEKLLHGETMPNQMEIDIVRKDGTIRHLQTLFKEVFWDGKQQYQSLYTDITEHQQAEEQLKQAAQEWRTTFDSITDLIFIHDKDNRIIRVNKAVADMLKTTPNELVGKYCHEVMHGTKEPPANCPHLLTVITGKSTTIEWFNPDTETYFHESSSPVFNEKGEVTGSIVVARDVTQQKRIEQQLIMTDRLASIGELSSGIAHELNNPLTSVIGFSQLLMEGDVPANIKEDLATIYNEAQRAAVIVKNLLTFARKHAPVKQLSQVNTVVEDVLKLRTYEQKVNNIEVEKHLAINLPGIMIDYFQMQQVFLNIVINAEFAMLEAHHKGRLTITTEKVDDIIRISFVDDGPGISEENLKHIFDPFFTTKEVGKGTGLGLSICHGIVSEHGGKIYAKSENGQGTSFIVELPLNGQ